jgi:hypothetical protein
LHKKKGPAATATQTSTRAGRIAVDSGAAGQEKSSAEKDKSPTRFFPDWKLAAIGISRLCRYLTGIVLGIAGLSPNVCATVTHQ